MLLEISNLSVSTNDKKIINHLNLQIKKGEVHAIMGPNGAGKSTLANIITGKGGYDIIDGQIKFCNQDINKLPCDKRARLGIFMSYQHPVEIPGVSWNSFFKSSVNSIREEQGLNTMSSLELLQKLKQKATLLEIDLKLLKRDVNYSFSGGEKKKFEMLQMLLLNPKFVILDEIDSGLDIDALRVIAQNINNFRNKENAVIIITHYNRILDYIIPDFVHIFLDGRIVKSGDKDLAIEVEAKGYDEFK